MPFGRETLHPRSFEMATLHFPIKSTTRMHSSRMRTAHSSSRGGSAPPGVSLETLSPWVWGWRPSLGCGPGDPPGCGPGDTPLGVGLETTHTPTWGVGLETPQPDPSTSPLGVGLETCKACWDIPPRPARHAGIPHPNSPGQNS